VRKAARIAVLVGALALPAGAQAATPHAYVMVVGKAKVLQAPRDVALTSRAVRVGGRRCAVPARSPLSALLGTRLKLGLRDYARCSGRAADASGLYVARVGPDAARGRSGWVYKVGHVTGSAGAADPDGARLRGGASLLWFWCRANPAGGCQRTLDVRPASTRVAAGAPLRVTVRGYDDQGRGVAVAGATVRLGDARAVTGADGVATVTAPAGSGRVRLVAARGGMVRSFGREISIR
jgi:hypothetical protein